LVLGLGNPLLGDEGTGVRVIEELRGLDLPDGVDLVDGGTLGLGLIALMEGYERAIIVDAAEMGQPPGRVVRFTPADAAFHTPETVLSPHQVGFGQVLALAGALDMAPGELTVFGVQPGRIAVGQGLSDEVEAAIPEAIGLILGELGLASERATSG
jgi:hydrogenase maturation protease